MMRKSVKFWNYWTFCFLSLFALNMDVSELLLMSPFECIESDPNRMQ